MPGGAWRSVKSLRHSFVKTLESPDEIEIGDLDELIAVRRINERELRVVYEEINSTTVVIYTVINARTRS